MDKFNCRKNIVTILKRFSSTYLALFKNGVNKNNRKERQSLIQFWILKITFNPKVSESTGAFFGKTHYLKEHFRSFGSLYYRAKEDGWEHA